MFSVNLMLPSHPLITLSHPSLESLRPSKSLVMVVELYGRHHWRPPDPSLGLKREVNDIKDSTYSVTVHVSILTNESLKFLFHSSQIQFDCLWDRQRLLCATNSFTRVISF